MINILLPSEPVELTIALESKSKDYTEVFDIRRLTPIASAK